MTFDLSRHVEMGVTFRPEERDPAELATSVDDRGAFDLAEAVRDVEREAGRRAGREPAPGSD